MNISVIVRKSVMLSNEESRNNDSLEFLLKLTPYITYMIAHMPVFDLQSSYNYPTLNDTPNIHFYLKKT